MAVLSGRTSSSIYKASVSAELHYMPAVSVPTSISIYKAAASAELH